MYLDINVNNVGITRTEKNFCNKSLFVQRGLVHFEINTNNMDNRYTGSPSEQSDPCPYRTQLVVMFNAVKVWLTLSWDIDYCISLSLVGSLTAPTHMNWFAQRISIDL